MYTISQEKLWKKPEGCNYIVQFLSDNEWAFIQVSEVKIDTEYAFRYEHDFIGTLQEACKKYDELSNTKRLCRISRYLPEGYEQPVIIEILKYYEQKD